MQKVQRRVLFYTLIGVFLVITPVVLLYAIGYSIDFQKQSFIPAGGIFLKTNQTGIRIFINGKAQTERKETSFLTTGALFNNLRAGTYAVKIEKEGFRPWEQTIEVRQRVVSEYRTIFLVPTEAPITERKEVTRIGAFEYFPSPDGTYVVLLYNKGLILTVERNADHAILFRKEVKTPFEKVTWLDDATLGIKSAADGTEWIGVEFLPGRFLETPVHIKAEGQKISLESIIKNPAGQGEFFALTKDGALFRYSGEGPAQKLFEQTVYAGIIQDQLIFINEKGFLSLADLQGHNIAVIGRPGFFLRGGFTMAVSSNEIGALVDGVGGAFFFDRINQKILTVFGNAKKISFDETGTIALIQKQKGISVVFLVPEDQWPFRAAVSQISVIEEFPENIIDSTWYGKRYILFSTEKGFYGAEFADKPKDTIVQKLSAIPGYLFTDNEHVTIINDTGTYILGIE